MDDGERAKEWADRHADDALEEWRRRQPAGESLIECERCGEDIPEERRQAVSGCTRCVKCQRKYEWIEGRK